MEDTGGRCDGMMGGWASERPGEKGRSGPREKGVRGEIREKITSSRVYFGVLYQIM